MRLTGLLFLAACTAAYALPAHAECVAPKAELAIPDGKTATEQELMKARERLIELDRRVGDYQNCLAGEASQKSVGKDEATRNQIAEERARLHNAAVEELTMWGMCLQAQFEAFQASGGGTQNTPVDCSTYKGQMPAGTTGSGVSSNWVTEADGRSVDLPTGIWSFTLYRDNTLHRCGDQGSQQCFVRMVYVRNGSNQALECTGTIEYAGTDILGKPVTESRALVPEKSMRAIVISAAEQSVNASTFDAACVARPPLPPLDTPSTCKYEVVKPVSIGDYYPESSRTANEQGPVVVEFTLKGPADHPTGVKVVSSSMYPAIDAAAVKAVSDMVMSSECKKARFRLKLTFKLDQ
jgi:TonB family protein